MTEIDVVMTAGSNVRLRFKATTDDELAQVIVQTRDADGHWCDVYQTVPKRVDLVAALHLLERLED